ncbi:MAG: Asp-tRNA(Asn)/Glu-tRNA(Gln) amidotransferase subunit GatC [Sulfurimonas sp.]|nr:Asp-tRNA(Asn)/Glu-tRNA(Gln) amidotransferase subunit GatC [Sulfurimonas sp.]
MQLDDELLTKLEKLSFLKISDDKRGEVMTQLAQIMSFVDNLSELDTEGVDDNFAMSDKATFAREDLPFCNRDVNNDILKYAPLSGDHFFIVPKIIE